MYNLIMFAFPSLTDRLFLESLFFPFCLFLAHQADSKAQRLAYNFGRPLLSVVVAHCRPRSLNIFFAQTTGPTEAKFHTES